MVAGAPLVSVVIPVHDESAGLDRLFDGSCGMQSLALRRAIFVNDGSRTYLARAVGQAARHAATACDRPHAQFARRRVDPGLEYCRGACAICRRGFKDPPELIPQMVARWREGYESLRPSMRCVRSDPLLKRATAACFYWLLTVFLSSLRSQCRTFVCSTAPPSIHFAACASARVQQGLFAWIGFRTAISSMIGRRAQP